MKFRHRGDFPINEDLERNPFNNSFGITDKDLSLPYEIDSGKVSARSDRQFAVVVKNTTPARAEPSPIKIVHESSFKGPYKKQQLMQKMQKFAN
jgi:hypothetical protein